MTCSAPSGLAAPSRTPAYSTCRKQVSSSAAVDDLPFCHGVGRRRVVGQDDRTVAAGEREVDVVGVLPALHDLRPVGQQVLPVRRPVVAVLADGREQEREPGRAGRRRGSDEQVAVGRVDEVVEAGRRREVLVGEPRRVDIDADAGVVDRRQHAVVVTGEAVLLRAGREVRVVRREHALVERGSGEGVVDAERDVADRVALGDRQLAGELAAVAGGAVGQAAARLLLEGLDDLLRQVEGVVGDEHDLAALARCGVGRTVVLGRERTAGEEHGREQCRRWLRREAACGRASKPRTQHNGLPSPVLAGAGSEGLR